MFFGLQDFEWQRWAFVGELVLLRTINRNILGPNLASFKLCNFLDIKTLSGNMGLLWVSRCCSQLIVSRRGGRKQDGDPPFGEKTSHDLTQKKTMTKTKTITKTMTKTITKTMTKTKTKTKTNQRV